MTDAARFWSKVRKTDGCWYWTRYRDKRGYGIFTVKGKNIPAHRWAYEEANGPIPAGLTIDHTCHNQDRSCLIGSACVHRGCVRPDHLEAVTQGQNTLRSANTITGANLRKGTCGLGHLLIPRGTTGHRYCPECARKSNRERRWQKRREAGIPEGTGGWQKAKTHCPQGHEYSADNTRIRPDGSRICRTCQKERESRRWRTR